MSKSIDVVSESSFICAGDSPTFQANIGNEGSEPSGGFNVRWLADGVHAADGSVGGIANGGSSTHEYTWAYIPEGSHELRFIVDSDNQIAEISEGNNEYVVTVTVDPCSG